MSENTAMYESPRKLAARANIHWETALKNKPGLVEVTQLLKITVQMQHSWKKKKKSLIARTQDHEVFTSQNAHYMHL